MFINKRLVCVLLTFLLFTSALLAGCMSDEEKQQASENVALATPIIEKFIDANYNGARIKDIQCATYTGGALFPETYASDYVRANITYNFQNFSVMTDVKTGDIYTDYYTDEFKKSIYDAVISKTGVPTPDSYNVIYSCNDVSSNISKKSEYFIEHDIKDYESLLDSTNHTISIIFNYANTNYNLNSPRLDSFFKKCGSNIVNLSLVNYYNKSRYNSSASRYNYLATVNLFESDVIYNIKSIRVARSTSFYSNNNPTVDNHAIIDDYYEIAHLKKDGIEFVWNKSAFNVKFSETSIRENPPQNNNGVDYGYKYIPIKNKAIKATISSRISDNINNDVDDLNLYFDPSLKGNTLIALEENMLLNEPTEITSYTNYSIYINASELETQTITFGLYKKIDTSSNKEQ